MRNNWYVITGGPSTGKTTLLTELSRRGYATVPEAARTIIDENLANGITVEKLRQDEKKFQESVVRRKAMIEASLEPNKLLYFDRGMQDTTAYLTAYNFATELWVQALIDNATYRKVFLLEPVTAFENDYARTEDASFSKQLHLLLRDAYSSCGITVVIVPSMSVEDRATYVLKHTNQKEML